MSELDIPELRDTIYHLCLEHFDGNFSAGEKANNKLHLDFIAFLPALRSRVSQAVAAKLEPYEPDLVIGVPTRGDWLATDIGHELGIPSLLLAKDAIGNFLHTSGGEEEVEASERPAVVDDLFRTRYNVNKLLAMPGIGKKAVAAAAVVDRDPDAHVNLALPHHAIIEEYIPPIMPPEDPRWVYVD